MRTIKTLGAGASGLVQKAFWPAKAEFVAVKKINILEREKRHQLMNDIKALCNTPIVPGLIHFKGAYHAADRGQIAVALEYMDGGSLADVLERVGRIPEGVLSAITKSVLQGLAYLHHHHTVHRDIKPANILMSTSGESKVSDFGISAFVDNTVAQCHTFLGTVTYMSPERINGQPYAFPADIWALGLAMIECATGKYPYDASGGTIPLMIQLLEDEVPLPPRPKDIPLSNDFCDFVTQCMAKDPMRRPTAEDLLRHPFITQAPHVDLRAFMRCMYDREEKIQDAVAIITARFYNNLSLNWGDEDSIAAFYGPDSTLEWGPKGAAETMWQKIKGKYTVAQHFHHLMVQLNSASGGGNGASSGGGGTKKKRGMIMPPPPPRSTSSSSSSSSSSSIVFDLQKQQHKSSSTTSGSGTDAGAKGVGDEGYIMVSQRVIVRDESNDVVLGVYDEVVTVRLRNVDALGAPGVGFTIASQKMRWIQTLVVPHAFLGNATGRATNPSSESSSGGGGNSSNSRATTAMMMATPPKCRQQ